MFNKLDVDKSGTLSKPEVRTNDEFRIENKELCIKNEEFCIENEEFCIQNE